MRDVEFGGGVKDSSFESAGCSGEKERLASVLAEEDGDVVR